MAIRAIETGNISCDQCDKQVAKITASKQIWEVLDEEARYLRIKCIDCHEKKEENNPQPSH